MLSLLSWILSGFLIGLIARAIIPGPQKLGCLLTILLGVAGAFVGGLISTVIWPTWTDDPDASRMWPGWIMAIIGAVIVLGVYAALTRREATPKA